MLNPLNYLITWLRARCRDENGQSLVEYGLIIALIAVGVIVALGALGVRLSDLFTGIKDKLQLPGP
ncbi:MAG: Flp family type IVb pilin [Bacillota bacterium]|nr:Flp family type IVb pilin [Bacillota bacterium]